MATLLWPALEYLRQGGWIMMPLAGVSVVMWTLIIERWLVLRGLRRGDLGPARAMRRRPRATAPRDGRTGLRARLVQAFLAERTGRRGWTGEILRSARSACAATWTGAWRRSPCWRRWRRCWVCSARCWA